MLFLPDVFFVYIINEFLIVVPNRNLNKIWNSKSWFVIVFQAQKNREILRNIGKRSSGIERPIELERFEPYRQHRDLNAILNTIAEAASQANDRAYINMQTPDYYFDETNGIDAKPMMPFRYHSVQPSASHLNIDNDAQANPFINSVDDSEQAWNDVKQMSLQQKQQPTNGHKSLFRQLNQQINEKPDSGQQQQQQKPPPKSFNSNGDFIQSLELN